MLKRESIAGVKNILVTDEITLSGTPNNLTGIFQISNNGNEKLFFRDIPLTHSPKNMFGCPDSIKSNTRLIPGSINKVHVNIKLPSHTKPGTYDCTAMIGGVSRKIKLVVEHCQQLKLEPKKIFLEEALPGKAYDSVFKVHNSGNVVAKIPAKFNQSVMLDNNYLCKSFALSFTQKGKMGFMNVLDGIVNNISSNYAKPVKVSVKEAGETIEPGASKEIHITFRLPDDIEHGCNFSGHLNIGGTTEITYHVNT